MNKPGPQPDDGPQLTQVDRIDQACDRFEADWRAGRAPRIEDYLVEVSAPERPALVGELLPLEVSLRRRAGERPEPGEYRARLSDWLGAVEAVFGGTLSEAPTPAVSPGIGLETTQTGPDNGPGPSLAGGGSAPIPAGSPAPPIHGYEIVGELGRGGMGIVYLARQVRLNRPCALKMIRAGQNADPEAVLRFLSEAEAVARLHHPNIVQVHALGEAEGLPFAELEYVEGGSLAARLDGTPRPAGEAAATVEALALAVEHAHRAGVVHRDLKPSNVLLAADGTPKVADFGLAKLLGADSGLTQTGAVLGTPSYMAPEQAGGRHRDVGPSADVYALGAILYELLTGRPPFQGATVQETLEQVRSAEPVSPSRLVPKTPRDLETIALKCLEKEPSRRYVSAEDLAEDLRRFRAGEAIRARRSGPAERAGRWCRRHPAVAALTATVALLLLTGTLASSLAAVRFYELKEAAQDEAWKAEAARGQAVAEAERADRQRQAADRQRARADEEARRARRASDFLAGLFQEADIFALGGRNFGFRRRSTAGQLKARDILDRGAEQAALIDDDPMLRATLLDAIGNAYLGLGVFEAGEQLLAEALEIRRARPGTASVDVAASQTSLAFARYLHNDPAAVNDYRHAMELWSRVPGGEQSGAITRLGLGMSLDHFHGQGMICDPGQPDDHAEEARRAVDEAVEILRERGGASRGLAAALLINAFLRAPTEPLASLKLAGEAGSIISEIDPNDNFVQAALIFIKANAWHEVGDRGIPLVSLFDPRRQAIKGYEEAIRLGEPRLGENHYLIGLVKYLLGQAILIDPKEDLDRAEASLREALAIFEDWFGDRSYHTAGVRMHLARAVRDGAIRDGKDLGEAEALIVEAIDILREHPHPSPVFLSRSLYIHAMLLNRQDEVERALPLQEESVELALRFDPEGSFTASKLGSLALILTRLGRYEEAEEAMRRAVDIRRSTGGDADPEMIEDLFGLGRILDARRDARAAESYREVLEILGRRPDRATLPDSIAKIADIRLRLATGVPLWYPRWFFRPLDPVRPSHDGSLFLLAEQVKIENPKSLGQPKARVETKYHEPSIGYWNEVKDLARWVIDVPEPGPYRVEMVYDCVERSEGSLYLLSAPGSSDAILGRVAGTGRAWGTAFRTERLAAQLLLAAGEQEIRLTPLTRPGEAVMNLRLIRLVPVPEPG